MVELIFVRHGQASFGAANYDILSERGHRQAEALGKTLKRHDPPDALARGGQRRHREMLEWIASGLGTEAEPQILEGLNEFDFAGLLKARFPEPLDFARAKDDPKTYFAVLKETVLAWQADEIASPPERFSDFRERVLAARVALASSGARRLLVATSGGPIALLAAEALSAPGEAMVRLQMQIKNCAVTRFVVTSAGALLHTFNETPHVEAANAPDLLSYH